jgi:hypothetical protein
LGSGSDVGTIISFRGGDAFRQGLREAGYEDGENCRVVLRFSDNRIERLPALARELLALEPAVVVSTTDRRRFNRARLKVEEPIGRVKRPFPVATGCSVRLLRHFRAGADENEESSLGCS